MADILEFKKKEDPHITGPARCLCCGNIWAAVAPVGTTQLECAECKTMKGVFLYPVEPKAGTEVFTCNCGCQLFFVTREYNLCTNCGYAHWP